METPKEAKRRGRPPKYRPDPPVAEGAEADGLQAVVAAEVQAENLVRAPEGLDEFLGRIDRWQAQNIDARVGSATFPKADKMHANVFNGFKVTDGPARVTLSTGETIEI